MSPARFFGSALKVLVMPFKALLTKTAGDPAGGRLRKRSRPSLSGLMFVMGSFACGGGSGGAGCTGCAIPELMTPFPAEARIANSAQVRLTSHGLAFIEQNAEPIIRGVLPQGLSFPLSDVGTNQFRVCEGGDCVATFTIREVSVEPDGGNGLQINVKVAGESRDGAGNRATIPVNIIGWTTCQLDLDTAAGDRDSVTIGMRVRIANQASGVRAGFSQLVVSNAGVVAGQDIENADVVNEGCNGIAGPLASGLIGFLKGAIITAVENGINERLASLSNEQLCTQATADGRCPEGSTADDNNVCRVEGGACVPMLLGTSGEGDLGATLLGSTSPGTHGPAQFVLAAGGDAISSNNGLTVFGTGGFLSFDRGFTRTPGHHPCVPELPAPQRPVVPQVAAFQGNTVPNSTTPTHVSIGVAEAYLNHAAYGLYDSGAMCLEFGTRTSQQLNSGTLAIVSSSLASLAFPGGTAPISARLRPQQPFEITVGTGVGAPLISLDWPALNVDFYVFSSDRFVRFLAFQSDLHLEINLNVVNGQLVPEVTAFSANNPVVRSSELLAESPAALASSISTLLGAVSGQLLSAIEPITLPTLLGIQLSIPEGGIQGIFAENNRFLSISADLATAPTPGAPNPSPSVSIRSSNLNLDPNSMSLAHWNQGPGNRLTLDLASTAQNPEWSVRLNQGPWSAWQTSSTVVMNDPALLLQGVHHVEVRSRQQGTQRVSRVASRRVVVDTIAPSVEVDRTSELEVVAHGTDYVSNELEYRFQLEGGAWSAWSPETGYHLPRETSARVLLVEVRDEAQNVQQTSLQLSHVVRRAQRSAALCTVSPVSRGDSLMLSFAALLGAAFMVRRRFKSGTSSKDTAAWLAIALACLALTGCDCGGGTPRDCGGACGLTPTEGSPMGNLCCPAQNICVSYDLDALCQPGYTCPPANVRLAGDCALSCTECMLKPPLPPGLLATDLDIAVDGNDIFVSGYSPGNPTSQRYGDLVFSNGMISQPSAELTWEIIDGVPTTARIAGDPAGWREGIAEPGPDVGRFTSMVSTGGTHHIAYYDATRGALKLASGTAGAWTTQTIDDAGDAGRYPSLIRTRAGSLAVSYLRLDAQPDGTILSRVMLAVSTNATPTTTADWTSSEVASDVVPCRSAWCPMGQSCLATGACAAATSDCAAACASGETCVAAQCQASVSANFIDDWTPAYGLFSSLVELEDGRFGLVFYDRVGGNLNAAVGSPGSFATTIIDGRESPHDASGDSGNSASLAVGPDGVWHVAYVDVDEDELRYASCELTADNITCEPQLIDDGSTDPVSGQRYTDGRHVVGHDASLVLSPSGDIRIAYQDATSHALYLARRASAGDVWERIVLDAAGHTGFHARQVLSGEASVVAAFYRDRSVGGTTNGVRFFRYPQ